MLISQNKKKLNDGKIKKIAKNITFVKNENLKKEV